MRLELTWRLFVFLLVNNWVPYLGIIRWVNWFVDSFRYIPCHYLICAWSSLRVGAQAKNLVSYTVHGLIFFTKPFCGKEWQRTHWFLTRFCFPFHWCERPYVLWALKTENTSSQSKWVFNKNDWIHTSVDEEHVFLCSILVFHRFICTIFNIPALSLVKVKPVWHWGLHPGIAIGCLWPFVVMSPMSVWGCCQNLSEWQRPIFTRSADVKRL